jgi:hypothetical protein
MMARPRPPNANPTHWTLKPDGGKRYKGTYFRRLEDIKSGLRVIDASRMPAGGKFLFLYYGCEKLGKGIVGIHRTWDAEQAYEQPLDLAQLKLAAAGMGLAIPDAELDALFVSKDKTTARLLAERNRAQFRPVERGQRGEAQRHPEQADA